MIEVRRHPQEEMLFTEFKETIEVTLTYETRVETFKQSGLSSRMDGNETTKGGYKCEREVYSRDGKFVEGTIRWKEKNLEERGK